MKMGVLRLWTLCVVLLSCCSLSSQWSMTDLQAYLDDYNVKAQKVYHQSYADLFTWMKNQTDYNQQQMDNSAAALIQFDQQQALIAQSNFTLNGYSSNDIANNLTLRELQKIQTVGLMLSSDDSLAFQNKISSMQNIYNAAYLCRNPSAPHAWCPQTDRMYLDPDITLGMASSSNYSELLWLWQGWHDQTGPLMKSLYQQYVTLGNKGAQGANFQDMGDYWRSAYEDANFTADVEAIWDQMLPLYEQLHAYMRTKLANELYPGMVDSSSPIPAHLLGDMWAQDWSNLLDRVVPFKNIPSLDVTSAMQNSSLVNTPQKMWLEAQNFYNSIGLPNNTDQFWNDSQIVRPADPNQQVECHGDAETFYNKKDYGIVMCTKVNMGDFITIHHEMGHVQYFMAYSNLSIKFQDGANPGFHEAIGDTMALSVGTPAHLSAIGLLQQGQLSPDDAKKQDINFLLYQALQKIAFLPFGFLIDKYRWAVFNGQIPFNRLNEGWWEMRAKYQGISPPVPRSESTDFDPGAKFHIPANVPYIRYFVSYIVQFQFYRALCEKAGHTGPLHTCDFYNNVPAGDQLMNMLKMGASQPWPAAMQTITSGTNHSTNKMDATGIIDYFQPLLDYLQEANKNNSACFGWGYDWPDSIMKNLPTPRCPQKGYAVENAANAFLDSYNSTGEQQYNTDTVAQWTFYTNTTDYNAQQAAIADANFGVWQLKQAVSAQTFDSSQIQNAMVNRQLTSIKTVGINLTSDDTQKLSTLINNMNNIFSNSRICPFGNPSCNTSDPSQSWALDPDLSNIMAYNQSSGDYDLQTYVWNEWRKKTQPIKDIYPQFVNLSNKGAQQGGFADTGAWWRSWYNTEDPNYNFQQAIDNLFMQVLPLYEELHTYVRRQLRQHYPNRFSSSAIPAHILGNMWAQEWQNIFSITQPFPNKTSVDVTQAMIDQNYTPLRMFQTADKFFQSLGLTPMVDAFWNGTIMTKPTNVEGFVCHASAWDFFNRVDFRIKMCTQVRMEDLITIHHEMGHIQYFMQYSVQPVTFRNGANPGFHEAIGDTIALSVATPTHLQKIGLLANYISDTQQDINFLYKQALEKVAFLPFGYLIDQWRWQVFSGQTTPDQYNADWWKLRTQYQGIVPPVDRPDNAFDPAAKSHIDDNTPYIRYFISYVAQFQFYKAMCQAANHTGPLYTCDFYNNTNAGAKLASMLRLGNSVPWNVAMNTLTGQPNIDASAILEYFKPLKDWLHSENLKAGDCYGWGYAWDDQTLSGLSGPRCGSSSTDTTTASTSTSSTTTTPAASTSTSSTTTQSTTTTTASPTNITTTPITTVSSASVPMNSSSTIITTSTTVTPGSSQSIIGSSILTLAAYLIVRIFH